MLGVAFHPRRNRDQGHIHATERLTQHTLLKNLAVFVHVIEASEEVRELGERVRKAVGEVDLLALLHLVEIEIERKHGVVNHASWVERGASHAVRLAVFDVLSTFLPGVAGAFSGVAYAHAGCV